MTAKAENISGFQAKLAFTRRKLHAWWEGYAFDEAVERAAINAQFPQAGGAHGRSMEEIVAEAIWGEGRLEPGAPVWTMRFARMLALPVRANVILFGAGSGAPLNDLKHGTRWKVSAFTRHASVARGELQLFDTAFKRLHKANAAGALSFFELHRESDPAAFARIASELLVPGAKAAFIDFTVVRKGVRLRSCFPSSKLGAPRTEKEFIKALDVAGFAVADISDETPSFMPLVAHGWAGWREAYAAIKNLENPRLRADLLRAMSAHAHLWAERFDAMKSGQLQVTCFQATRG